MKKLVLIALAFLAIQLHGQPQENKERHGKMEAMKNFTAEEIAELKTKKMTLHLDLNEKQQKEIYALNLENASKRKAHMEQRKAKRESGEAQKPNKEERLKMMNAKLDHQIAMKAKIKTILNEEQFTKWEKAQARSNSKKREAKMKHKRKQQE